MGGKLRPVVEFSDQPPLALTGLAALHDPSEIDRSPARRPLAGTATYAISLVDPVRPRHRDRRCVLRSISTGESDATTRRDTRHPSPLVQPFILQPTSPALCCVSPQIDTLSVHLRVVAGIRQT